LAPMACFPNLKSGSSPVLLSYIIQRFGSCPKKLEWFKLTIILLRSVRTA
jgi:hypothetical protein